MEYSAIISGALTGVIVGMTGVGGGAIMTPLLILLMGVAPHTAIGTDLLFATITKMVAVHVHQSQGTIDWQVVRRLAWGSLPAAVVTLLAMHIFDAGKGSTDFLLSAVGVALVLTSVAMLFRKPLHAFARQRRIEAPVQFKRLQPALTVASGIVLGVLVTLTSIGAGALGAVLLVYLYPLRLTPAKLVGTDLAHAIPVALVAGLGHLALGNVDFVLLGWLLAGSLPGVWLGSRLSMKVPQQLIRGAIAFILLVVGVRILA